MKTKILKQVLAAIIATSTVMASSGVVGAARKGKKEHVQKPAQTMTTKKKRKIKKLKGIKNKVNQKTKHARPEPASKNKPVPETEKALEQKAESLKFLIQLFILTEI